MAYTTTADLRIAAGGQAALEEISGQEDAPIIAAAQLEADAWIDGVTRRINSAAVPWNTADAPQIKALAAAETIYILRMQKRVAVERDDQAHERRKMVLEGIAAGTIMPSTADAYPVGDGGGAPVSGQRTATSADIAAGLNDRDSLRGLW